MTDAILRNERPVTSMLLIVGLALSIPFLVELATSGPTTRTATVVSGEKIELECAIWSPWSDRITIDRVSGGCSCTSATITPAIVRPWTRCVVRVVFDSDGKPTGRHRIVLRAFDSDGFVHELPVHFLIEIVPATAPRPEMDGVEALRAIRASDPDAKVVMVRALDQKSKLSECIRLGALDFIVKPFDRERLLGLLRKYAPAADGA